MVWVSRILSVVTLAIANALGHKDLTGALTNKLARWVPFIWPLLPRPWSPRKRIRSMRSLTARASLGLSILTTEPSTILTTGGSIESTAVTIPALPGRSVLI